MTAGRVPLMDVAGAAAERADLKPVTAGTIAEARAAEVDQRLEMDVQETGQRVALLEEIMEKAKEAGSAKLVLAVTSILRDEHRQQRSRMAEDPEGAEAFKRLRRLSEAQANSVRAANVRNAAQISLIADEKKKLQALAEHVRDGKRKLADEKRKDEEKEIVHRIQLRLDPVSFDTGKSRTAAAKRSECLFRIFCMHPALPAEVLHNFEVDFRHYDTYTASRSPATAA